MLLMIVIMSLPLLGIGLFFALPLGAAIAAYLAVVGFSVLYQWLMMGTMHLPARMGRQKMKGSIAVVRRWDGLRGQVMLDGEIWQAETEEKQGFAIGDKVGITKVNGLKLRVEPLANGHTNVESSSWLYRPHRAAR